MHADTPAFDRETVPYGCCYYSDGDSPPPQILVAAIDAIDAASNDPAAVTEWVSDGWV